MVKDSNKKIVVLGYTDKVPELMNIATAVITKPGGLTSTECLVMRKPMLIINPIPGQEEENAEFLLNNGAAVQIFDAKSTKPFIEHLLTDEIRLENIKQMQEHIAKPNSTRDIVDVIFKE